MKTTCRFIYDAPYKILKKSEKKEDKIYIYLKNTRERSDEYYIVHEQYIYYILQCCLEVHSAQIFIATFLSIYNNLIYAA